MLGNFKTGRYTVTRFNNQMVTVTAPNAPTRFIYTVNGAGSCDCPKYGKCGHTEAVEKFIAAEAKNAANSYISLDDKFAWN